MTNNINININKAILSWSTEGVCIHTGVNIDNVTFNIDSVDKDGYVVMWCNPLSNRFYVYPQNLVTNMKDLVEQFPKTWKRSNTIGISFRTNELYYMFCAKDQEEIDWRQENRRAAVEALNAMLDEAEAIDCVGLCSFVVKLQIKVVDVEEHGVDIFRTYSRTIQCEEFDDLSEISDVIEDPKSPAEISMTIKMDTLLTALGALESVLEGSSDMEDHEIANHLSGDTVEEVRKAYDELNAIYLND